MLRNLFTVRIIRKSANPMMRNSILVFRNTPYTITGAPAYARLMKNKKPGQVDEQFEVHFAKQQSDWRHQISLTNEVTTFANASPMTRLLPNR